MKFNQWRILFLFTIILFFITAFYQRPKILAADLLISEVQITGGAGKTSNDFIKIFNNTDSILDLTGYRLVKRTKTGTTDTTIKSWTTATPLNPRGFYLWANSVDGFATSLSADCSTTGTISDDNGIAIRQGAEDNGIIIDSLAWGSATNAFIETSAFPNNPEANRSLKRINNQDTNNNTVDFELTGAITPPADNPVVNQTINTQTTNYSSGGGDIIYCQATKGDVLINEFSSNPSEDEEEWIELINKCSKSINLEGWTIEDGAGTKTTLSGIFDKYFIIDSPKGKLNNTGDLIILKNYNGQIIDEIIYGSWQEQNGPKAPGIGQSLALDPTTKEFVLNSEPTKGSANTVRTKINEEEATVKIATTNSPIIISEILPNPLGADNEAEFIELFNQSPQTITLKDWQLSNEVGQIFTFGNITITASTSVAFYKITTGLSFKNDHDVIKLYAPNTKTATSSVNYKNAPEGQSYIYNTNEKNWFWSLVSTPNKANILIKPNTEPTAIFYAPEQAEINEQIFLDGSDSFDLFSSELNFNWDFDDKTTSTLVAIEHAWSKAGTFTIKLTVSDGELSNTKVAKIKIIDPRALPELTTISSKNNSQAILKTAQVLPTTATSVNSSILKISAIVVAPPGLFGTQWFYAMPLDDAGKATNAVIQIYNNKKEFPDLKIGDLVEAQGELYAIKDDTRLKTKTATDITVLEHDNILVEKTVNIGDLNKNLVNELITVNGQLAKKQGNNIILSENGKELLVELKANTKLRAKDFTPDSSYQITGLLKQADEQLKLWPRYIDDIVLLDNQQVLGDKITASTSAPTATINFINNKGKEKTLEYLLITALGLIIGLSVLLFKFKKSSTE